MHDNSVFTINLGKGNSKMNVYGVKCKAEKVSIRIRVVQGKILQLKKCETVEA